MALRLACLFAFLAFVAGSLSAPAGAYNCGKAGKARTLSAHVEAKECTPAKAAPRRADPISLAFFVGLLVAVLLVPVALGRREDLPPQ